MARILTYKIFPIIPFGIKGDFHSTQASARKNQMERTIFVWSDRNIRDQLWRWFILTRLVISSLCTAHHLPPPTNQSLREKFCRNLKKIVSTKLPVAHVSCHSSSTYFHRAIESGAFSKSVYSFPSKKNIFSSPYWGKRSMILCKPPTGEGVLLGILGGGVPNPDPISDQKMSFSTPVFRPDL